MTTEADRDARMTIEVNRAVQKIEEVNSAARENRDYGKMDRMRYEANERARQALELRLTGVRYDVIAQKLGYASASGVHYAVKHALAAIPREAGEEVLAKELARVDVALLAIWPQVKQGVVGAVDRFVKLMHLRAQYLGLFAPTKIAMTDPTGEMEWQGKSDSELIQEFESVINQARERTAKFVENK